MFDCLISHTILGRCTERGDGVFPVSHVWTSAVLLHVIIRNRKYKCDFKLLPQCVRYSFFWIVRQRSLLVAGVSGQPIGFIFTDKALQVTLPLGPIGCLETPATTSQHYVKPQKSEFFELAGWDDLWRIVRTKFRENRLFGSEFGSFCFIISSRPLACLSHSAFVIS